MTAYLNQLAGFLSDTQFADLPAAAVLRSRRVLSDSIAAIAAGAGEPEVQALTAKLLPGAPGAASLIGQSGQAATATAAFLNGTAGTFLELY